MTNVVELTRKRDDAGPIHTDPQEADLLGSDALRSEFAVTIFPDRTATRKRAKRATLVGLAKLVMGTRASRKDALPLLSLGKYGKRVSEKGSLRHKGNLRSCHGVEADYDAGAMTPREAAGRLSEAGIASLIYTSPSHGLSGKGQRWRVICPFSRPLPPEDRKRHVAAIDEVLGSVLARESYTLSQSYYYGGVGDRQPEIFLVDGDHIDACLGASEHTYAGDPAPALGRSDEIDTQRPGAMSKVRSIRGGPAAPGPATDESEDPDAVAYAGGHLAQAAERLARVESGENRNAGLNSEAFAMGGFVACGTLTADEVVEALGWAADANGYTYDHGARPRRNVLYGPA